MIIRDPLWNNIRVDALALQLVDTPVFQRLRYVRQLGLAYLVYPGATHTRFEHALGAYHLARLTIALLDERGELAGVPLEERAVTQAAALLHDVGHYPFSHALEEIGALHHEEVATPLVLSGSVAEMLRSMLGAGAPERVLALIRGTSDSPLQGLVSGSLDLETAYGAVEAGIREGTAAWLDVAAASGRVRNLLTESDGPEGGEDSLRVRARTAYGNILIRRA